MAHGWVCHPHAWWSPSPRQQLPVDAWASLFSGPHTPFPSARAFRRHRACRQRCRGPLRCCASLCPRARLFAQVRSAADVPLCCSPCGLPCGIALSALAVRVSSRARRPTHVSWTRSRVGVLRFEIPLMMRRCFCLCVFFCRDVSVEDCAKTDLVKHL